MTITITQMYIIMPVLALAIVLAWHFVPVLWRMFTKRKTIYGKPYCRNSIPFNHEFIPEGYKEDKELKAMVRKPIKRGVWHDHDGGPCPIPKSVKEWKIKYRARNKNTRDVDIRIDDDLARDNIIWNHSGGHLDIFSYMIPKKPAKKAVKGKKK